MSGRGHTRAGRPFLPAQRRGELRLALLAHYDVDPEIRAALKDLARRQPANRYGAEYDAFEAELVTVAGRFGLDRLRGDDGVNVGGVELLRRWARLHLGAGDLMRTGAFGLYPPELADEAPPLRSPLETRRSYDDRLLDYANRWERQAVKVGYLFPDTAPRLADHIRWLFLRLRHHGITWNEIANREEAATGKALDERAVSLAVRRLAPVIGADL